MKKILLSFLTILSLSCYSQTAVNFNVNDCSGTNHDLFTDLNAGKVVVIAWVMPCAACIGPSLSAYNEAMNYASSNPGRVKYYLVDDLANTNCTTLTSWANTNGITGVPVISNAAINMTDYGSPGMPKIVVLAGANHDVLFNENDGLNVTNFNNAIASGLTIGINENSISDFNLAVFPNPSTANKTTLKYTLIENTSITVEIYNSIGDKIKNISFEKQSPGKHESNLDMEYLANGIYFLKLKANNTSQVIKITVAH